ncbi:DNA ligase D [Peribacillus cavernae]|uniref:DNA ligase (ATP) n=1 Tax=Peribacillus cavernae TaxID=1674310 RepID=A0A433HW67_9BACI|nr:DNA ligase D [Peribacillus cavernae]MDQ0217884.1 bifunctional non-homologous end joining protein LigD [Peribacillus cavernae]RUQ32547.1 DNA ligase D [Peribacillus cavernae]
MKPMLPTYHETAPKGKPWGYEVKYDGFRAILVIEANKVELTSRNGKDLLPAFPEIERFVNKIKPKLSKHLPVQFDGELVWLANPLKADFMHLQWRGRLRIKKPIEKASLLSPVCFMAFDLLMHKGKSFHLVKYHERKKQLETLCGLLEIPLLPSPANEAIIQYVPVYKNFTELFENVVLHDGEGIVAKHENSFWEEGKRTPQWVKTKNWRTVACFISAMNKENSYFTLAVYKAGSPVNIGQMKNGIDKRERAILQQIIMQNASSGDENNFYIHPSICLAVNYLHAYDEAELRESQFKEFLTATKPEECTWERFTGSQFAFPAGISVTSADKPVWKSGNEVITKIEYMQYLREVSSWFLPHLTDKGLTTIRYPHGTMNDERFFQKNRPEYAPEFVKSYFEHDNDYILCNDIQTLIWLGNQLAIEFHTPFQRAGKTDPDEIVLDLDPPSPELFQLAVKAAVEIKKVLDSIKMKAFIKTSGNKGLQIHIPLPADTFGYQDTRIFTDFLGDFLIGAFPDDFTVERLKKNRYNRLYLDFVQHSEGKTIISPYSARGNDFAGVATPLYWDEVTGDLSIKDHTVLTVPKRIRSLGCPFSGYEKARNEQPFEEVIRFLKQR